MRDSRSARKHKNKRSYLDLNQDFANDKTTNEHMINLSIPQSIAVGSQRSASAIDTQTIGDSTIGRDEFLGKSMKGFPKMMML